MQLLVSVMSLFGAAVVTATNSSLTEMAAISNFYIRLNNASQETVENVGFKLYANKTLSCEASNLGKWPSKIYPCSSAEYTFSVLNFDVVPVIALYHDLGDG